MNGLKNSDEAAIYNALNFARTSVRNILYLRAIQVHTEGIRVDPTLRDNDFIYSIRSPFNLQSINQAAKTLFKQLKYLDEKMTKKSPQTVFFTTMVPLNIYEEIDHTMGGNLRVMSYRTEWRVF